MKIDFVVTMRQYAELVVTAIQHCSVNAPAPLPSSIWFVLKRPFSGCREEGICLGHKVLEISLFIETRVFKSSPCMC